MEVHDITEKHGREMYALGLKHALELAKIYADSGRTLPELVELLQEKLDEETAQNCDHSNFDEYFEMCTDCKMTLDEMPAEIRAKYRAMTEENENV